MADVQSCLHGKPITECCLAGRSSTAIRLEDVFDDPKLSKRTGGPAEPGAANGAGVVKYAVLIPSGAYVSLDYGPVSYTEERYASCMTEDHERAREVAAREGDGARVVRIRILSHEEAKAKARAEELRFVLKLLTGEMGQDDDLVIDENIVSRIRDRANELWPEVRRG